VPSSLITTICFYRIASMQAVSVVANRPSSVCVNCDKTKETSAHILIPYERSMHVVLQHEEWLVVDVL